MPVITRFVVVTPWTGSGRRSGNRAQRRFGGRRAGLEHICPPGGDFSRGGTLIRMPLPPSPMIGTCGFAYPEWRGRFYPPELGPPGWLRFYAESFTALELDGTFYRPPAPAVVAGWAEQLPERFALAAKVPRTITHELRLAGDEAVAMLHAFAGLLAPLGDRLFAVLLQLPPSLTAAEGARRLERLLASRPAWLPIVVEVRHRSWYEDWLPELLEREEAGLARVEKAGGPGWSRPVPMEWTGPVRYGRLLGDREELPEIGRKVRDLSPALDRWAAVAGAEAAQGRDVAIFVNNRYEGAGFVTAAELRRRAGQPVPDPRELWPAPPLPGLELDELE
jgi:uncharacterized protein YecE (DUF72 family)